MWGDMAFVSVWECVNENVLRDQYVTEAHSTSVSNQLNISIRAIRHKKRQDKTTVLLSI